MDVCEVGIEVVKRAMYMSVQRQGSYQGPRMEPVGLAPEIMLRLIGEERFRTGVARVEQGLILFATRLWDLDKGILDEGWDMVEEIIHPSQVAAAMPALQEISPQLE